VVRKNDNGSVDLVALPEDEIRLLVIGRATKRILWLAVAFGVVMIASIIG